MKKIIFTTLITIFTFNAFSQDKFWVFFTDKDNCSFNPYSYFDQKAIDRRIKHGVDLYDITDFPVNENYIASIKSLVDSVNIVTRWFNGISVMASNEQISKVEKLQFVREVRPITAFSNITSKTNNETFLVDDNSLLIKEMNAFGAFHFKENNIDGSGVRIAVFDAGFPGVDTLTAFKHIRDENRIIKTYDFHKKNENVYKHDSHGTNVLSCIAGIKGEHNVGMASGAEFLLARTEIVREIFVEEEYWLAAAEWADKNGADIINSSLGYTVPRYFQKEMDGKSTLVSQAAKKASDKGILVINAMGNDGDGDWKVVGAPADVEEVLSIGGVDPFDNVWIYFSSVGPTADKRMKPNVCAAGEALVAMPEGGYESAYGTSFATPLVTGFAACALQTDTTMTNMELKEKIEKSGHLYPYFDYAHGYGIPQASYFIEPNKKSEKNFEAKYYQDSIVVSFQMKEEELSKDGHFFFYKFKYEDNYISLYSVVEMFTNRLVVEVKEYDEPVIFEAFFKGYFFKMKLEL